MCKHCNLLDLDQYRATRASNGNGTGIGTGTGTQEAEATVIFD